MNHFRHRSRPVCQSAGTFEDRQPGHTASGDVQFADFLLLSANFGKSTTEASAVPEPGTGLMLIEGLVGLV